MRLAIQRKRLGIPRKWQAPSHEILNWRISTVLMLLQITNLRLK